LPTGAALPEAPPPRDPVLIVLHVPVPRRVATARKRREGRLDISQHTTLEVA
jgi:hypothetical protein